MIYNLFVQIIHLRPFCHCFQVFLAALAHWSCLAVTVDRLVYVLSPHAYYRRMTRGRVAALLITAWLLSLATAAPPAFTMVTDDEFVLDEVCAIAMTTQYAIGRLHIFYIIYHRFYCKWTVYNGFVWFAQTKCDRRTYGLTDWRTDWWRIIPVLPFSQSELEAIKMSQIDQMDNMAASADHLKVFLILISSVIDSNHKNKFPFTIIYCFHFWLFKS